MLLETNVAICASIL